MRDLAAINLTTRTAVFDDDSTAPITHLFDCYARDTDDPKAATSFVAGPDPDGRWHSARVDRFDGRTH